MKDRHVRHLVVAVAIAAAFIAGQFSVAGASADTEDATYRELSVFSEVLAHIQNRYVEDMDSKVLIEGAIRGMFETLDPHSAYMDVERFTALREDTRGQYVGVGMEIGVRDERVVVITVFDGGPAAGAGVRAGDTIFKIDEADALGWSVSDVVHHLRGQRGSGVRLSVLRDAEELSFDIVRDVIHVVAVQHETPVEGFGLIQLRTFQESASSEIRAAIDALEEENGGELQGLVLDLRNNPGGLLSQAIAVSDLFLSGEDIVSTAGRDQSGQRIRRSQRNTTRYTGPLVVLVNGGSASASEIVAGALRDNERAVVLGTQTFGKGSVQSIIELSNGAGIKLTIEKYYTPSGESIHGTGISPDFLVESVAPAEGNESAQEGAPSVEIESPTAPSERMDLSHISDNQLRAALMQLRFGQIFNAAR